MLPTCTVMFMSQIVVNKKPTPRSSFNFKLELDEDRVRF